jgi:hypothetical protein
MVVPLLASGIDASSSISGEGSSGMDAAGGGELRSGGMRQAAGKDRSAVLTSLIHLLPSPLHPLPSSFASMCCCCSPDPRYDARGLRHVTLAAQPLNHRRRYCLLRLRIRAARRGVDLLLRSPPELLLVFINSRRNAAKSSLTTCASPSSIPTSSAPVAVGPSPSPRILGTPRKFGGLFGTPG